MNNKLRILGERVGQPVPQGQGKTSTRPLKSLSVSERCGGLSELGSGCRTYKHDARDKLIKENPSLTRHSTLSAEAAAGRG